MLVVADSSPLVYLSRIGRLDVLAAVYGRIVIPARVWAEVVEARPGAPGVDRLVDATWLEVDSRVLPVDDLGLDPGETAAILLAEALGAELLLIDERAGREVARARGLGIRGTLGALVQARQMDLIPALRPVLTELIDEGFRLAPELAVEALKRVGEWPQE